MGRDLNQVEEFGFLLEKGDIWSDFSENDRGRTFKYSLLQNNEKTGKKKIKDRINFSEHWELTKLWQQ